MILLLDNAHDSAQVRPLLPGSTGCLVIVTSRNRFAGLIAHEAAHPVLVGRLDRAAGWDLLARRLGDRRLTADPAATGALLRLCAGLPLALSITAARAAVRPNLSLADVVAEMEAAAHRLDGLRTGEPQDDVRSAFSWSYAALSPSASRLFRLLAVHPAAEIPAAAAASIAGTTASGEALAELHSANMITELGAGRYAVHDLLHAYAAELLDGDPGERDEAEHRLIDHYLYATRAAYLTYRLPPPTDPGPPPAGVIPVTMPDDQAALDWYVTERPAIVGAIDLALDRGRAEAAAVIVLHVRPLRSSSAEARADSREQTSRVLAAVEQTGDSMLTIAILREAATLVRGPEPGTRSSC
ncbi:NB-ARC domain-containing protein [Actinoplanes sp. NPDC049596]|uniref:NB-ARC domain-containing protein n=1 Tax=unclassified Actinoplanes TaxID=2626549 RepID=UPI00342C805B